MWSPQNRQICTKCIEKSRKQVKNGLFSAVFWSKWRDSNSRPPVPETGALPTALHLDLVIFMRFSVSGQTCGQTENLRTFKTSGEPKKSVFSRGFSDFENLRCEIGGLLPNWRDTTFATPRKMLICFATCQKCVLNKFSNITLYIIP